MTIEVDERLELGREYRPNTLRRIGLRSFGPVGDMLRYDRGSHEIFMFRDSGGGNLKHVVYYDLGSGEFRRHTG